jgi:hypothetical protein
MTKTDIRLIRIIADTDLAGRNWLYSVLDSLDTFTLACCRDRSEIRLSDATHTLILDNFSSAKNPNEILNGIYCMTGTHISTVAVIDYGGSSSIWNATPDLECVHVTSEPRTRQELSAHDHDLIASIIKGISSKRMEYAR